MIPGIWCKGHDLEGRVIYDMNDTDPEQNEVSTRLAPYRLMVYRADPLVQTALQIYTASYKAIPQDESFALLRKATRLDQHILQLKHVNRTRLCDTCGIDASPRWYAADTASPSPKESDGVGQVVVTVKQENGVKGGSAQKHLCHQCWFKS